MKEFIGPGSINELKNIIDDNGFRKIFLVTGRKSYEECGARDFVDALDCEFTRFSDFTPNPKLEDVKKGLQIFRRGSYDTVVAIGGGSAIDVAKAINVLSMHNGDPKDIVKQNRIENRGKPLIAIPTTSGSGSEATHFAVIYIDKSKYSLGHKEYTLPDYCIVDSDLTETNPSGLTASSGMDALCQAIEAFWSVGSNDESKEYSGKAIKLAMENLEKAVNSPDSEARLYMARAAHLAGKAINIAKTTACHAISYLITTSYGVPHGHAVGLTLGKVLVYNASSDANVIDPRKEEYLRETMTELCKLLGVSTPQEADEKLRKMMVSIHLETSLSKLGVRESDIEELASNVNLERLKNNPRQLTKKALVEILERIL